MTVVSVHRNTWVQRPPWVVFEPATDLRVLADVVPGVRRVTRRAPLVTEWAVRWPGVPHPLRVEVTEWVPGARLRFRSLDGHLDGLVAFIGVNRRTTAVTVHATYRPDTVPGRLAADLDLPRRLVGTALRRLKRHVEAQPAVWVPDFGTGDRPLDPDDLTPPPPAGVPTDLGVTGGAAHASGSPGGLGSMGVSSDRLDLGGRVGPADLAGVPAVRAQPAEAPHIPPISAPDHGVDHQRGRS